MSRIARPPARVSAHSIPTKPPSAHISDQAAATIPAAIKEIHQWVVWRWTLRDGKWSKPPINPLTGRPVNAVSKTVWMTFDQARESAAAAELAADGIGFALGPNGIDGLVGVDLDKCVDDRGNIDPTVKRWIEALGSYTERTPSGRGLRVWIRATIPGTRRRKGNVEVYDRDRYFTITGDHVEGTPPTIEHRQEAFEAFYSEALADGSNGRGKPPGRDQNSHAQPAPLDLSDDELVRKAREDDPTFGPLFDGITGGRNASSADMALMNKLAFWFGRDPTRMERVFSGSKLAERGKWTSRPDYRERTIRKAIADCPTIYAPISRGPTPSSNGNGKRPAVQIITRPRKWFSNSREETNEEGKAIRKALTLPELLTDLDSVGNGWPKRIQDRLFVGTVDHKPVYLESATQLFGWLDSKAPVHWSDGPTMITQARFYEHVRQFAAEQFETIETLPHHPLMLNTFYMHKKVTVVRSGKHLDQFLDFFTPATPADRVLLEAAILTLFWGGPPGQRPAFRFRGPEDDPPELAGRGTGKTTTVELFADLAGGLVDLEENEDITDLKTRLLSSEEGRKRVIRIDNLKTLKLSWAALEKFISSRVISGHALYRGESQRPNTITVFITINGGTFSKDMAQRVIEIQLNRPTYSAQWLDRVTRFLEEHRWELIGEIIGALSDERATIETKSRWPTWEREVLAQCPDFNATCQEVISKRVEAMDDDDADALECEEYFKARLIEWKHNPETQSVIIPTAVAGNWLSEYEKRPMSAKTATTALGIKPLKRLTYKRTEVGRYWIWRQQGVTAEPVPLNQAPF